MSETTDSQARTASTPTPLETVDQIVSRVGEQLPTHVNASTVFGEPVTHGDRTVIPVARVSMGFGFGAGAGQSPEGTPGGFGGGGGGGGGAAGEPVGYIEITPTSSRFVPTVDVTRIATTSLRIWSMMLPRIFLRAMRRRRQRG
ncbi:MAG TPA: spore germination protein GerW family protein [Thermomicrobiaceae bacterium]|nr:spore germination protein GerW family protein [Thermomicrobiaceae bacterium]